MTPDKATGGRWVAHHTCDGNGPFPCDDRCRKWVEDVPGRTEAAAVDQAIADVREYVENHGYAFKAPSASERDDARAARRLARPASDSEGQTGTDPSAPRGVALRKQTRDPQEGA